MNPYNKLASRLRRRFDVMLAGIQDRWRLLRLTRQVARQSAPNGRPVAFFNASARLYGLSLNAAFSLLTSWGLRAAGVPVVHFVCQAGMSRCVLGTQKDDHTAPPPCRACVAQSRRIYAHADTYQFSYVEDRELASTLHDLSLEELTGVVHQDLPLGRIVLPSLRWALRRHHLQDDLPTRFLMRQYILSAFRVAQEFTAFLDQANPVALVVFNGIMYPEAIAARLARQRGVKVVTHEVSFQPFAGFFTAGEATAYPIDIPQDFALSAEQNAQLDAYLERRFQGQFTMAGIRFWPQMRGLEPAFLERAERFRQIVPVFTNVIFDTSQIHANTVFPHMFAWLDLIVDLIKRHPETLFVIRAHPDEMRAGKQSRESVHQWVHENQVLALPNVEYIASREYLSSYALIQRAKLVMVYNSSIGLEAAVMGAPVLCGGQARYTQYPTVFFPSTPQAYREQAEQFLSAETIDVPAEFQLQARRFLYYQLFRTSLPFSDYLQNHPMPGYVSLKSFSLEDLKLDNSVAVSVIHRGLIEDQPFLLQEEP